MKFILEAITMENIIFSALVYIFYQFLLYLMKDKKYISDHMSALFTFVYFTILFFSYYIKGYNYRYYWIFLENSNVYLACIFYFYVCSIIGKIQMEKKMLIVIIPVILNIFYLTIFKSDLITIWFMGGKNYLYYLWEIFDIVNILIFPVVGYLLYKKIKIYRENLKKSYSFTDEIDLNSVNTFTKTILFSWIAIYIIKEFSWKYSMIEDFRVENIAFLLISFIAFYYGELSKSLAIVKDYLVNEKKSLIVKEKYIKSGIGEDLLDNYEKKLQKFMKKTKPYLINKLTLAELSEMVKISNHNLSELLNTRINKSFYEFINDYRINEFKELVKKDKDKNYNLLDLAFQSGFNSKSSFNRSIKDITGFTPSQLRVRLLNNGDLND